MQLNVALDRRTSSEEGDIKLPARILRLHGQRTCRVHLRSHSGERDGKALAEAILWNELALDHSSTAACRGAV